jgi:hypothetical protein
VSLSDQIATYGALATVASITTAIQATVALLLVNQEDDVRRRKASSVGRTQARNSAIADAKRYFRTGSVLNFGALTLNGAVLASWGGIVYSICSSDREWYLLWPFIAVDVIWLILMVSVIVFLSRMHAHAYG